jgi:hypothetical protein
MAPAPCHCLRERGERGGRQLVTSPAPCRCLRERREGREAAGNIWWREEIRLSCGCFYVKIRFVILR